MLRSLNLNEKIISKSEEEELMKSKIQFIETFLKMYQLFLDKVAILISMGLYQRAFNMPCPFNCMYR